MMNNIYGNFTFHPVGQGLFYSGFLIDEDSIQRYSIVYDCGSETTVRQGAEKRHLFLETEIAKFLSKDERITTNGDKLIDLLIISHFDDDHINGLENLLADCKVDKVIMPYYKTEILDVLQAYSQTNASEAYLRFLRNPYAFFNGRAKEIILYKNEEDMQVNIDFQPGDFNPEVRAESVEISGRNQERKGVFSFINSCTLSVSNLWTFSFFNKKADPVKIDLYLKEIESIINKNSITLEELLTKKTLLKQLKNKTPFKTSNLNSVLCLHFKNVSRSSLLYLPRRFYYGALLRIGKQATLLTGDFNEPSQKDIADIKNWISLFKQEIGVFLVPHHGAKNIKITNYSFSPVSIISFGIHNRHRHPTAQVLKAIAQSNTNLICVNEANGFCYYVE